MRAMSRLLVLMGIALSVFGVYLSAQLLIRHATGKSSSTVLGALCGRSGVTCDKVLNSRWGVFPPRPKAVDAARRAKAAGLPSTQPAGSKGFRVPVAFFGMLYFSFLAAWFLGVGRPNERGRRWHLLPTLAVLAGNAWSAWFIYVMATELKRFCTGCMTVHVVNLLLLILVLVMWPRRRKGSDVGAGGIDVSPAVVPHPTLRVALLSMGLAFMFWLTGAMTSVALAFYTKADALESTVREIGRHPELLADMVLRQDRRALVVRPDDPARGPDAASHTVLVFADLQCAECKRLDAFLAQQVEPLFGRKLRVVFKHYPLCTECNRHTDANMHPDACRAAFAAEAARLQGGNDAFWKMHDELTERLEDLADVDYRALAGSLGLDGDRLVKDMEGEAVRRRVAEDIELARAVGVEGTPWVFFDDRPTGLLVRDNIEFWKALATRVGGDGATSMPVR